MGKNGETELAGYNITVSVRIDREMEKKLENIAIYERARAGTLLRMWIHDKIETYYRNPNFLRWLKRIGRAEE